jgi:hypothetical protein
VISHAINPEIHTFGYQKEATAGLTFGLALMTFLDVALGWIGRPWTATAGDVPTAARNAQARGPS